MMIADILQDSEGEYFFVIPDELKGDWQPGDTIVWEMETDSDGTSYSVLTNKSYFERQQSNVES